DGRETVEHVGADALRIALERIAVAGGVRHRDLERVARLEPKRGHLRGPVLLPGRPGVADHRRVDTVVAAEDPPGRVGVVPLALAGADRVDEEAVHAHHADPAAPLPSRARLVAQLVALRAHREAPL